MSRVFQKSSSPVMKGFDYGRWTVEHKADKELIGYCGSKYIAEFNEVELGYRYLPEYGDKAMALKRGKAALNLFSDFGVDEAIALILLGNKGSEHLVKTGNGA